MCTIPISQDAPANVAAPTPVGGIVEGIPLRPQRGGGEVRGSRWRVFSPLAGCVVVMRELSRASLHLFVS